MPLYFSALIIKSIYPIWTIKFLFCRYALLNETWHLVNDGYLDVKDVDKVMSDGLGMRYAFLGILETTHLNAEGFVNYCERYANTIHSVSNDFKPTPKFEGPLVPQIAKQLESDVPLEKLQVSKLHFVILSYIIHQGV